MAVGVELRPPEQLEDAGFHAFRDDVLQVLRLLVDLVPRITEDLDQEHLQQAVVPHELQRDLAAFPRELLTAVTIVLDQPLRGEPRDHLADRGRGDAQTLGKITGRDGALVAVGLCPPLQGYLIASHRSAEPGHRVVLRRLGLQEEPPANYTLQAYVDMLRRFGPLWVTTDVGSSGFVAVHARIMTGAYGDGTPAGTNVWLIDPADGRRHHETFEQFVRTFEQLARDVAATDPLWIQVVHNAGR